MEEQAQNKQIGAIAVHSQYIKDLSLEIPHAPEIFSEIKSAPKIVQYTRQIQREKIDKIVNKQIRANHNKSNALLKRKIGNDLVMQGFYREDINSAIDNSNFSDDKLIMQKEYEKIKNRLFKKYSHAFHLIQRNAFLRIFEIQ